MYPPPFYLLFLARTDSSDPDIGKNGEWVEVVGAIGKES